MAVRALSPATALLFLMTLLVGCHSVDGNEEIIETPLTPEESVAYDLPSLFRIKGVY